MLYYITCWVQSSVSTLFLDFRFAAGCIRLPSWWIGTSIGLTTMMMMMVLRCGVWWACKKCSARWADANSSEWENNSFNRLTEQNTHTHTHVIVHTRYTCCTECIIHIYTLIETCSRGPCMRMLVAKVQSVSARLGRCPCVVCGDLCVKSV